MNTVMIGAVPALCGTAPCVPMRRTAQALTQSQTSEKETPTTPDRCLNPLRLPCGWCFREYVPVRLLRGGVLHLWMGGWLSAGWAGGEEGGFNCCEWWGACGCRPDNVAMCGAGGGWGGGWGQMKVNAVRILKVVPDTRRTTNSGFRSFIVHPRSRAILSSH